MSSLPPPMCHQPSLRFLVGAVWLGTALIACSGARVRSDDSHSKEVSSGSAVVDMDDFDEDGDYIDVPDGDDVPDTAEAEQGPTRTWGTDTLVPVFEYWNFNVRKYTVHADPPEGDEAKRRLLFYAFACHAPGSEAVGSFLRNYKGHVRMDIHMGEARHYEWQQGVACYAYPRDVAGSFPVFQFWNTKLLEHVYHMGEAESANEYKTSNDPVFYAYKEVPEDMRLGGQAAEGEDPEPVLTPIFEFTDHILKKKSFHSGKPWHGEGYSGKGAQFYAWTGPTLGTSALSLFFDTYLQQYNIHGGDAAANEVWAGTAFYAYQKQAGGTQPVFKFRSPADVNCFSLRTEPTWDDGAKVSDAAEFYAYASVPEGAAVRVPDEYPGDEPRLTPVYNFTNLGLMGRWKTSRDSIKEKATTHAGSPWETESRGSLVFWGLSRKAPGAVPIYSFHHNTVFGRRRAYTLHAGDPWPEETRNNIEFYAYPTQVPGTEAVSAYWHTMKKQPVYRLGEPAEYEELPPQGNGSVMFYAFRRPPKYGPDGKKLRFVKTRVEKSARELLEARERLIPWLTALVNHKGMQEVGELVSKSISTAMGATSLVLLFTPAFPVGIGLGLGASGISLTTAATTKLMDAGSERLLRQHLVAEKYLSDKFSVGMDITRARSIRISEELGVDENTSMFMATFSNQNGVVDAMSEAIKFVCTVDNLQGAVTSYQTIGAVSAVRVASETWAGMMTASTVLTGVGFAFSVIDLVSTAVLGNRNKKEALQIRDRVNASLVPLQGFVQSYDNMRIIEQQIRDGELKKKPPADAPSSS